MTASWIDQVTDKMRQINNLRAEMGDQISPADEIYRPPYMRRAHFKIKITRIQRLESQVEQKLTAHWGKYIKRKKIDATKTNSESGR